MENRTYYYSRVSSKEQNPDRQNFKEQGIRLKVVDLHTTMMDLPQEQEWVLEMVNNILIEVLVTIAEQERAIEKKAGRRNSHSKGKE